MSSSAVFAYGPVNNSLAYLLANEGMYTTFDSLKTKCNLEDEQVFFGLAKKSLLVKNLQFCWSS